MTKEKLAKILAAWEEDSYNNGIDWQYEIALKIVPVLQDDVCKTCSSDVDVLGLVNNITNEIKQMLYYFSEHKQPNEWYNISDNEVWFALDGQRGDHDKELAKRCIHLY